MSENFFDTEFENDLFEKCCIKPLNEGGVAFFPVRHHSPACAFHLREFARRYAPDCILIEGPFDGNFLIPYLADEGVTPPVCIYSSYVDRSNGGSGETERYRAYYPFLSYSPEYAAVKYAAENGTEAQFMDMPYAMQLMQFRDSKNIRDFGDSESAEYYRRTAEKSGCRNFSEFWESAFETNYGTDNEEFIRSVFMLGVYMRGISPPDEENRTRESYMREKISKARKNYKRILAVCGAYHVKGLSEEKEKVKFAGYVAKDSELYLMPYTFAETDSKSGYGAGIPFPAFYLDVWKRMEAGEEEPYTASVLDFIVKTARYARDKQPVSLPDEAQGFYMARELALLRGRRQPGAFELIDGVRSAFVKGSINTTAAFELDYLYRRMTGLGAGEVNITVREGEDERVITPPCVTDFRAQCKKFRINTGTIAMQNVTLDVVKNRNHYEKSCFLHRMKFLDTGFCKMESGPDYALGRNVNLVREQWKVKSGTSVLTRLIDLSVYGETVEAICREIMKINFAKAASAEDVGKFLLSTYMTGFSTEISRFLTDSADKIRDDSDFISQNRFMGQIGRLLTLQKLTLGEYDGDILKLLSLSYGGALCKIADIAGTRGGNTDEIAAGLRSMFALAMDHREECPKDEFIGEIEKAAAAGAVSPQIYGVMTALLNKGGKIPEEEYCDIISGYMMSAESENAAEFIYGVILTGRDAVFTGEKILPAIDYAIKAMDEEKFMAALPRLRRAFTSFLPHEAARIAGRIADMYGIGADRLSGSVVFSAEEIIAARNADRRVGESLEKWGLAGR